MSKTLRILLDLDEVLGDFVGAACRLYGCTYEEILSHWERGDRNCVPPLSKTLTEKTGRLGEALPLSVVEFNRKVEEAGEAFWALILPLPWMSDLMEEVTASTPDWWVVSNPLNWLGAYSGKARWLKGQFGSAFDRFHITRYKEEFARPNTILVDDCDENVRKFREAGGEGIVFPRWHNSLSGRRDDPVDYVRAELERLSGSGDASDDFISRLYRGPQGAV
jgi:hypothetical protein